MWSSTSSNNQSSNISILTTSSLIERYKKKIQQYINARSMVLPEIVFKNLLEEYISTVKIPGFGLFAKWTKNHIEFSQGVLPQLDREDFNLIQALNDYLKSTKLKVDGDFLALLIAFFYYYKNYYALDADLSTYEELKKQVIIPLSLYRKATEENHVMELLAQLESPTLMTTQKAENRLEILQELASITIPKKVINLTMDLLVQLIDAENFYDSSSSRVFDFSFYVLNILINVTIPDEKQDAVINSLYRKFASSNGHGFTPDRCIKAIAKITISDGRKEEVLNFLLDKVEHCNPQVRWAVWEALDRFGVSDTTKKQWIAKKIKKLCDNSRYFSENISYPGHIKYNYKPDESIHFIKNLEWLCGRNKQLLQDFSALIINNLRQGLRHPQSISVRRACRSLLSKVEIPVCDKEVIVMEVLNNDEDDYSILKNIDIPDTLRDKIVEKILLQLQKKRGNAYYVFEGITYLHLSSRDSEKILNELLSIVASSDPADPRELASTIFSAIASINIPEEKVELVISTLLYLLQAKNTHWASKNSIFEALGKIKIPANIRMQIISALLDYVIQAERYLMSSIEFLPLNKIAHTDSEREMITNSLLPLLNNNDNHEIVNDVLQTLYALQQHNSPLAVIETHIKVDALTVSVPPNTSRLVSWFNEKNNKLLETLVVFARAQPTLSSEVCEHIKTFM